MAFYHIIMIAGVLVVFLIMAWGQLAGGKKFYGSLHQDSKIDSELFKRITSNCGSWRNSAQVFICFEAALIIYAIMSSLICAYIAGFGVDDLPSIVIYSILSIVFTGVILVAKCRVTATGYRESFVDMKDALMKHSSGLIFDEELLSIFKSCEEKITKSVFY